MNTRSSILHPNSRNKKLRTFAFLRAQIAEGKTDPFDCLTPFLVHACANFSGEQFDEQELAKFVSKNYELELPIYLLTEVRPKLLDLGSISQDSSTGAFVCEDATDQLATESDDASLGDSEFDRLENKLGEFALSQGLEEPKGSATWEEALIGYFQQDSEDKKKPGTVDGTIVSDSARIDNFVISEFIINVREEPSIFSIIEMVFFGVVIAEFITTYWKTGNAQAYGGLHVVYDVTLLMRLLGTSGDLYRKASEELHDTITHLGCETFYFQHTYSELLANLEAVITAAVHRSNMHPETQAAIDSGEITADRVRMIMLEADRRLGELGITEHEVSYRDVKNSNLFQIDEHGLASYLQQGRQARGGIEVWERDAQSIALIQRLRRGDRSMDVSSCKAVFVTTNPYFAKRVRKFLVTGNELGDRDVSPVLTVGQMAIISWIADEKQGQPSELSRELIANCYRASVPSGKWDEEFGRAIESLDEKDASDRANNLMFVQGVRQIAYAKSYGEPALVKRLNFREIARQAEEEANKKAEEARESGVKQGIREMRSAQNRRTREMASTIAAYFVSIVSWVVLVIYSIAYVIALFPDRPFFARVIGGLVLFFLAVISLASTFDRLDVGNIMQRAEDRLAACVYSMLRWLQGANE